MNYKGIVDWLQEDGFVLMAFNDQGEVSLMEKATGREVNDLSSFLIATVLPIAKKKIAYILQNEMKGDRPNEVKFEEVQTDDKYETIIWGDGNVHSVGTGATFEYATVNAIEIFIREKQKEKFDDKG